MTAYHNALSFIHLLKAAAEDLLEDCGVTVLGKADNRKRRHWTASHCIYIAERVGRCDLSKQIWIVYDGREKIDRLHQGESFGEQINSSVIVGVEADQNIRVCLSREFSQYHVKNGRTQLGRASSGFCHGSQLHVVARNLVPVLSSSRTWYQPLCREHYKDAASLLRMSRQWDDYDGCTSEGNVI